MIHGDLPWNQHFLGQEFVLVGGRRGASFSLLPGGPPFGFGIGTGATDQGGLVQVSDVCSLDDWILTQSTEAADKGLPPGFRNMGGKVSPSLERGIIGGDRRASNELTAKELIQFSRNQTLQLIDKSNGFLIALSINGRVWIRRRGREQGGRGRKASLSFCSILCS